MVASVWVLSRLCPRRSIGLGGIRAGGETCSAEGDVMPLGDSGGVVPMGVGAKGLRMVGRVPAFFVRPSMVGQVA